MAVASFEELCAGYCEIVDVSPPPLAPDAEGRIAFHVVHKGVTVNLVHCPQTSAEHYFVLVTLGIPGRQGVDVVTELESLLDGNFVLQVHPPTFSRNPATGEVVLQYVDPLFDATPVDLHELIGSAADWVVRWRESRKDDRADAGASVVAAAPFGMLQLA